MGRNLSFFFYITAKIMEKTNHDTLFLFYLRFTYLDKKNYIAQTHVNIRLIYTIFSIICSYYSLNSFQRRCCDFLWQRSTIHLRESLHLSISDYRSLHMTLMDHFWTTLEQCKNINNTFYQIFLLLFEILLYIRF